MLRIKLPIFETKLRSQLLLLCTDKTNTIIIIDCQPFQHPFSLVLLQIFISAHIPNSKSCKTTNNTSIIYGVNDLRRIN